MNGWDEIRALAAESLALDTVPVVPFVPERADGDNHSLSADTVHYVYLDGLVCAGCGEPYRSADLLRSTRCGLCTSSGIPAHLLEPLRRHIAARVVVDDNGCWIWQKARSDGYGRLYALGEVYAHRVSWRVANAGAEVPEDFELDHTCRRRACVNPAHLEVVTHAVNLERGLAARIADGTQKGRTHGIPATYSGPLRCRCEPCCAAWSAYMKDRRAKARAA